MTMVVACLISIVDGRTGADGDDVTNDEGITQFDTLTTVYVTVCCTFTISDEGNPAITVGVGAGGKVDGIVVIMTGGGVGTGETYGDGENDFNEETAGAVSKAVGIATTLVDGSEDTADFETTTKVVDGIVTTVTPAGTDDDLTTTGEGGNYVAGGSDNV